MSALDRPGYREAQAEYNKHWSRRVEWDMQQESEWEGPPYEYGVTWGPRPKIVWRHPRVLATIAVIYVLSIAALVLYG